MHVQRLQRMPRLRWWVFMRPCHAYPQNDCRIVTDQMRNVDSPAPTKGKPSGTCKSWCAKRKNPWSEKCTFGDCGSCTECGECFLCAREGVMHIHATIVELSLVGAMTRSLRLARVLLPTHTHERKVFQLSAKTNAQRRFTSARNARTDEGQTQWHMQIMVP